MLTSSVSLLALDPAVPPGYLLSIDGQTKDFLRTWGRMANRILVRWEKKIESGIAPHNCRDGAAFVSREHRPKV
jgi:hypothetical protein